MVTQVRTAVSEKASQIASFINGDGESAYLPAFAA